MEHITTSSPNDRIARLSCRLAHPKHPLHLPEEAAWRRGYYAALYKHSAFLKVNKLFKTLAITVDSQNVSRP
jgi:hypothetical protein